MTFTTPGTSAPDLTADSIEELVNGLDGLQTRDTTSVRRLNDADIARCSELGVSRDWGTEHRKWGLLFEVGEVYGIEDEAGRLIATAVLTRYGQRFGAVSMVLVAQSHERQGFGKRIMRHVIDQAPGATLVLHATPEGRPLYEKLGFKTFGAVEAHVGVFDPTGARAGRSQPATPEDLLQLARLDHEVYGVHRTALLKRLPGFAERLRVLRNEEGLITGYGALWRSEGLLAVGPVLAPDVAGARDLITDLAEGVGERLRLDVDSEGDDLSAWACGHGLKTSYTCAHMVLGDGPVPMDRLRLHAPLMCALG
ncbi:MAG TPA: GNAT family N-acetyltransferase [Actinospica sp.]|nr:GNAT family N-acetyltransferase [Actinospica sp.]